MPSEPALEPPAGDRLRRRRRGRDDDGGWKQLGRAVHGPRRSTRRSACSTRPPSSCTATWPSCPRPSGRCWRTCTSPTRCCAGKKVLIVDDDMRNIFALSTRAGRARHGDRLGRQRPRRHHASCRTQPDVDIVLMDIMMPEMDGIDTMREIRKIPQLKNAADHRRDGQGHEGRPREVHRGRGLGLPVQAGRHRADAGGAAGLAASVDRRSSWPSSVSRRRGLTESRDDYCETS